MTECIDHGKTCNLKGYYRMWYKGKSQLAHRVAYCEAKQIPIEYIKGSVIRHTCDNSRCINPKHLLLGTQRDNVQDRQVRNRQCKGETRPLAVLTDADVRYIRKNCKPYSKLHSVRALAKRFGVSEGVISATKTGRTWQHIS